MPCSVLCDTDPPCALTGPPPGEQLFPLIHNKLAPQGKDQLASKVTGMLLDGMQYADVYGLLSSPAQLAEKLAEAERVLAEAQQTGRQ